MKLSHLLMCAGLAAIIGMQSCATPMEVNAKWKNPEVQTYSPAKTLVLVVGENMEGRVKAEDAFEGALNSQGITAVGAFETLPLSGQTQDTAALKQAIRSLDCDALLTARAIDVSKEQHWVPGVTTYPPPYYGRYGRYWGSYGGYGTTTGGYMDETTTALLETNLYDIASGDLIWVGQSSVVVSGNLDKLLKKYATVVVQNMMLDGAIASN